MDQQLEPPAPTIRPRRGAHRLRRAVAALLVISSVAAGFAAATPAGASSISNGLVYVDCNSAFGQDIHMGLDVGPAQGTTIAMYLWKWNLVNGSWVRKNTGLMDWAKRASLGWTQDGFTSNNLDIYFSGTGYYQVQIVIWNPSNVMTYNQWSGNSCAFW